MLPEKKKPVKRKVNYISVRSNDLIWNFYSDMSPVEQDIFTMITTLINTKKEHFEWIEFSIPDLCEKCGLNSTAGANYKMFKEGIEKLLSRFYWLESLNEKGEKVLTSCRVLDSASITKGSGWVEVLPHYSMEPYLLKLTKNFTSFECYFFLQLRRTAPKNLYIFSKSIHFNKAKPITRFISLEDLHAILGCFMVNDKGERVIKRKEWSKLKERVLIPAIKDINETTDILLSFEPVKDKSGIVIGINLTVQTSVRLSDRTYEEIIRGYPDIGDADYGLYPAE